MNAPAKFLFEDDFAVNAKPANPMVSLAAHQSALARAEEDGYRQGAAATEAQIAGRTAAACERIAQTLAGLTQGLGGVEARLGTESGEGAFAGARKLAPALVAPEPLREIAGLSRPRFARWG